MTKLLRRLFRAEREDWYIITSRKRLRVYDFTTGLTFVLGKKRSWRVMYTGAAATDVDIHGDEE